MMSYSYVFFDLDGTLADTDLLVVESYLHIYRTYRPQTKVPFRLLASFSGPSLYEVMKREFPEQDTQELIRAFQQYSWPRYEVFAEQYPHMLETLKICKEKGIKMAVITSKLKTPTLHTFQILGLQDYIDYAVTLDDVKCPKPHPEGILKALHYFQADKKDILYVGDAKTDMEAARNAGVDSCLVTWNLRGSQAVQANYIVQHPHQLLEVILHGKQS